MIFQTIPLTLVTIVIIVMVNIITTFQYIVCTSMTRFDLCMEEREEIVDIHVVLVTEETTGMMAIRLCMAFETYGIPW